MKTILFKPELLKKVMSGDKTQALRVIKPQPKIIEHDDIGYHIEWKSLQVDFCSDLLPCSPFQPGDIVGCKEAWKPILLGVPGYNQQRGIIYKIDDKDRAIEPQQKHLNQWLKYFNNGHWATPIFMPHEFIRTKIKILEANVWIKPWDSINDKKGFSWNSNPWCWKYKFEVQK